MSKKRRRVHPIEIIVLIVIVAILFMLAKTADDMAHHIWTTRAAIEEPGG